MRRFVLGCLVLSALIVGCGSGDDAALKAAQRKADEFAIEQIEVKWHDAATQKNVDEMMSIWADNATLTIGTNTYVGKDKIREFFATKAAPFKPENDWVSDTPAYKIRVTVDGDRGTLYFECHYIDRKTRTVAALVAADQKVQRIGGKWLITSLVSASPTI